MTVLTGARRRLLGMLAVAVAGALLGAGLVAWRTGTLPLVSKPCWGSVPSADVEALFGDRPAEDAAVRPAWLDDGELQGTCRIMTADEDVRGKKVDIRVHVLDGLQEDNLPWAREFLSTRLTPFGGGLTGMASDTRAWVALPDSCTGKAGRFSSPGIVDVAMDDAEIGRSSRPDDIVRYQKALARIAVNVANGTMAELGCSGALEGPGELAPAPKTFVPMPADREMCGIEGVRLPKRYVGSEARMRAPVQGAAGKSPVRGCDVVTGMNSRPEVHLRTVQEPAMTGAFGSSVVGLGSTIETGQGFHGPSGSSSPTAAALRAECPKGPVVFMAEDHHDTGGHTFIRDVFPAYVATEARRLGCGPLTIHIRT